MTAIIAKGSRSRLIVSEETGSLGGTQTGVQYRAILFSSETLVENIDTFKSQDIRPDRTTAAVRGGNVAAGGSFTSDFALTRMAALFYHLLGGKRKTGDGYNEVKTMVVSGAGSALVDGTYANNGGATRNGKLLYTKTNFDEIGLVISWCPITFADAPEDGWYIYDDSDNLYYGASSATNGAIDSPNKATVWTAQSEGSTPVPTVVAPDNIVTPHELTDEYNITTNTNPPKYMKRGRCMYMTGAHFPHQSMMVLSSSKSTAFTFDLSDDNYLLIKNADPAGVFPALGKTYRLMEESGTDYVDVMYLGVNSSSFVTPQIYAFIGNPSLPTAGLSVEKQVLGGNAPLFILYKGCRIDSLDLQITQKDITKSTWGVEFLEAVAGDASIVAPSEVILPTDDPVSGFEAFISLNGGTTFRPFKEASVSIKNNVEKDVNVVGSRVRVDLPEGMREISGQVTLFFTDTTEYELFKNESVVSLSFSFIKFYIDPDSAIGGGAVEFLLSLGEVKLTGSGTPQVSGAGSVSATFDFTAFKQAALYDVVAKITAFGSLTYFTGLTDDPYIAPVFP